MLRGPDTASRTRVVTRTALVASDFATALSMTGGMVSRMMSSV